MSGWNLQAGEPAASGASSPYDGFPPPEPLRCSNCHTSPHPTETKADLRPCPRPKKGGGPEVVLLDQLSNHYVPVVFAHRLHAEMTEMTGGCVSCHHYNPSNGILPCRECHGAESVPTNLRQPGLKGAYHRQCLNCHREWSHETECAVCHAKKTAESPPVILPDPTDIMGILHPNVEEPKLLLRETDCEHGAWVTFRHDAHVTRFGFACVRCHREENCSRCHSPDRTLLPLKSLEERHRPCSSCHETTKPDPAADASELPCGRCHADGEIPPFDHASTGLTLSEDHLEWSCTDCHREARYHLSPSCSECHEEDFTYPEKSPGTPKEQEVTP